MRPLPLGVSPPLSSPSAAPPAYVSVAIPLGTLAGGRYYNEILEYGPLGAVIWGPLPLANVDFARGD